MIKIIPSNLRRAIRVLPLGSRVKAYTDYAKKYLQDTGNELVPADTFASELALKNNDSVASNTLWERAFN